IFYYTINRLPNIMVTFNYKDAIMRYLPLILLSLMPAISFSGSPASKSPITHVIFITLDGIRAQDIFGKRQLMPVFWDKYAKHAEIYGEPGSQKTMSVGAKIPYSLPSYQSMMSGKATTCMDNDCGRLTIETLPEA